MGRCDSQWVRPRTSSKLYTSVSNNGLEIGTATGRLWLGFSNTQLPACQVAWVVRMRKTIAKSGMEREVVADRPVRNLALVGKSSAGSLGTSVDACGKLQLADAGVSEGYPCLTLFGPGRLGLRTGLLVGITSDAPTLRQLLTFCIACVDLSIDPGIALFSSRGRSLGRIVGR